MSLVAIVRNRIFLTLDIKIRASGKDSLALRVVGYWFILLISDGP